VAQLRSDGLAAWFEKESQKQVVLHVRWSASDGGVGKVAEEYLDGGSVDEKKLKVPKNHTSLLLLPTVFKSGSREERIINRYGSNDISVPLNINGSPVSLISVSKTAPAPAQYQYIETETVTPLGTITPPPPFPGKWTAEAVVNWRHGQPRHRCLHVPPNMQIVQAFPEVVWRGGAGIITIGKIEYTDNNATACADFAAHESDSGTNSAGGIKVSGWATERASR
jgi:hypothetical protein